MTGHGYYAASLVPLVTDVFVSYVEDDAFACVLSTKNSPTGLDVQPS